MVGSPVIKPADDAIKYIHAPRWTPKDPRLGYLWATLEILILLLPKKYPWDLTRGHELRLYIAI